MKKKISVTIDEELVSKLNVKLEDRMLRNRSHVVEVALAKFLEDLGEVKP